VGHQSEHETAWVITLLFLLAALGLKVVLTFIHNS
jgi:hypothetical protein